jgi:hypothetical protein
MIPGGLLPANWLHVSGLQHLFPNSDGSQMPRPDSYITNSE